jgi:hypothetical protein
MNQFEEAKLKAQKRMERQARYAVPQPSTATIAAGLSNESLGQGEVAAETPKENHSLIITVLIQLPDQSFELKFRKASVYQNASRSRLTKQEFKNRIKEGLKPLLGGIDEFPGGS